jgi:hypothetical protein
MSVYTGDDLQPLLHQDAQHRKRPRRGSNRGGHLPCGQGPNAYDLGRGQRGTGNISVETQIFLDGVRQRRVGTWDSSLE